MRATGRTLRVHYLVREAQGTNHHAENPRDEGNQDTSVATDPKGDAEGANEDEAVGEAQLGTQHAKQPLRHGQAKLSHHAQNPEPDHVDGIEEVRRPLRPDARKNKGQASTDDQRGAVEPHKHLCPLAVRHAWVLRHWCSGDGGSGRHWNSCRCLTLRLGALEEVHNYRVSLCARAFARPDVSFSVAVLEQEKNAIQQQVFLKIKLGKIQEKKECVRKR